MQDRPRAGCSEMTLFRTFIAVDISPEVRARAATLIQRYRACRTKVSWADPDNLHLTLKFLGDTPDTKIPDVCQAVARAATGTPPFQTSFDCVGAFPNLERPRVIWFGVAEGVEILRSLQARIEDELYAIGFRRERRRYTPHLTIGRVREGGAAQRALADELAAATHFPPARANVQQVLSMASFLDPEGATYQVLGRAPLGR